MAQIQKNLGKLHPHIEGDKDYGFKYASFITSNTVFAASAGLSGAAVAGQLRYDTSEATYKYWNGSAEVALAAASALGVGLDGAYDQGKTITVDAATITLTGSNADVLTITNSANAECINITKTGAGVGYPVQIQNSGTGEDIYGTSGTWKVSKAGAATFTTIAGTDLTFTGTQTITTDDTSGVAINIEADSLTTGTAIEVDSNTGAAVTLLDLQNAGTSCFIVSGTGILTLAGVAKDADAIAITAGDITLTAGDIDMSSGQFTLVSDQAGDGMTVTDTTGAGNYDLVYFNGTTSTGSGSILKIDQGASIRTGHMVDLNMGTTSVGMSAIDISCTGGTRTKPIIAIDSDGTAEDFIDMVTSVIFTGNMLSMTADTGAATGNFIYINNDSGTSMEAINIDDETNVADTILIDTAANIGAAKAALHVISAGTPNATANAILVDWTGATATNTPYMVKLDSNSKDIAALSIDSDAVTDPVVLIHGGGALTNGLGVLNLTNDGNLAAGGNLLNVTMGGTPADETVSAVEILAAKNCMALDIASSAIASNCVRIIGSGALTDGLGVLSVSSAAALAAGGNLLNLTYTGTPADATVSAVDLVVSQDCLALDVVTSAATTDAVRITGVGSIADNKALLQIAHGTGTVASGGSLVKLTGATAATAGAYGMTIDCSGANFEALWVEAGQVKITESIGVGNWTVDAATVTSDGSGTGVIPDDVNCVQLTSANTDYWAVLPTPTPGKEVWIIGHDTSACELRSSTEASVAINNVVGAGCELTILADTTYHALCINATNWIVEKYDNVGAPTGGGTPN